MKTQEEFIKEILDLKTKNPEMEIRFFAANEFCDDDGYTLHKISNVEVDCLWWNGCRYVTGEEDIKEEMEEYYWEEGVVDPEGMARDLFEKEVKAHILVYTEALSTPGEG